MTQADSRRPGDRNSGADTALMAQDGDMRILAVGLSPDLVRVLQYRSGAEVHVLRFADLAPARLAGLMPDAVVAPLLGEGFDILDLARRLERLGYRGRIFAVADTLPNAAVVLDEIRGQCDGISVEFIALQASGRG